MTYTDHTELIHELIHELIEAGKSTGKEESENLLNTSKLNEIRMNKLYKRIVLASNIAKSLEGF